MNFPLFIAKRLYSDQGDKRKVSRPAIHIATAGVAIGLAIMIMSVCVVLGFKHTIRDKVIGFGSHIQVADFMTLQQQNQYPVVMNDSMVNVLKKIPGVKHVQKFAMKEGILKTDSDFLGVMFKGVGPDFDSTFIHQNMIEGSIPKFDDKASHNQILISQLMADKLKLKTGERIFAYFFDGNGVRMRRFTIKGIYQTNLKKYDEVMAYTDLYTLSQVSDTEMSASFARLGNPKITWETTTNFNIGTEFSFFKGRLSGSFDFYTKKTTDLLFWLRVPESQGTRGYYSNVGDLRNTGVELTLTGHIFRTKDFDWSVTANLAHNKTKILKLDSTSKNQYGGFSQASDMSYTMYWYKEGGPLYNGFMPKYAGVNEKGEALYWVDEDISDSERTGRPGQKLSYTTTDVSKASNYETGSLLPKVSGGLSTTVSYKGFDATFSFDYQIGGKVYDMKYAGLMNPLTANSTGGVAIHKDYIKSWSPNNTSSNIPRWQYGDDNNQTSDRFLTNASYFNFQSFTVGYTFPKNLIPYFSKIRIYCSGENLGFISARKGLDPRYSYDGVTGTRYSPTRNISGCIQLTF